MRRAGRRWPRLLAALALLWAGVGAGAVPLAAAMPANGGDAAPAPLAALVARVAIPHEQFRLNNGLTVVVHTDRKAPLVSVGVWYLVGARDEPMGKSGFAHLFEHIMFRGSQHSRQDHFRPLEDVGATDLNGTTDFDRTNYFQTVPTPALELALFLESDRMGWLLPALSEEVLASERAIVLNEKRQGENQPGGLVLPALLKALFPPGHPYAIPAIGQEADLEAATLADAKRWFADHYGPNNAVLVLAGDIDAATARPLVEKWFGQIPPGPTPARHAAPLPVRSETTREVLRDRVATARLIRAWALPGRATPGLVDLDIGLATLGGGPTSLLFDRLVREERLAVGVSAGLSSWLDAGIASITIEVRPGVDPAVAEARADQLVAQWLAEGPDADAVTRVATRVAGATIRGLERVGGGGGKGAVLAEGALLAGDPADYARDLAAVAAATPESVMAAARRWLGPGDHRITLLPGERPPAGIAVSPAPRAIATPAVPPPPRFVPQGRPADRAAGPPPAGAATSIATPPIQRARLSNGLAVELVEKRAVPVVRLQLTLPVGIAGDAPDRPGTQRMMLALLREGTAGRLGPLDGAEIARRAERLGMSFGASASLDQTRLGLNALAVNLPASLALFADIVRAPSFPPAELERVRGQILASLESEAVDPNGIALRAAPPLLYGPEHAYGTSFSGNGTREAVASISRDALLRFHASRIHPGQATLIVVGDIGMDALLPMLEQALGDWRPGPARPAIAAAAPRPQAAGRIILYDRPGSPQSVILAGAPLPLSGRDDTLPATLANDILGGGFTARLNKLLREEKGWTYGASSSLSPTRLAMPFLLQAPVEADRTADSIVAIRALLDAFRGARPADAAELERAKAALVRSLPGQLETGAAMLSTRERALNLGRPDDYLATLPARAAAVPLAAVRAAPLPASSELAWIVVGDRARLEPQLKALGMPVEHRTPDAAPARP